MAITVGIVPAITSFIAHKFVAGLISLLVLQLLCPVSALEIPADVSLKRSAAEIDSSYDYVIIGGGTSGLTVADRLTEDGTKKVLVVEYGYVDNGDDIVNPPITKTITRAFYNLSSIPQSRLNYRRQDIRAAAVVGGGSSVNGMLLVRASSEDYNSWASLGNPGWDWKSLLPYFKKSYTFTPPTESQQSELGMGDDPAGYSDGPIQASFPPWQWPAQQVQWKSWLELGIPASRSQSTGNAVGIFWNPSSQDPTTRKRSYAVTAFYNRDSSRQNYHLLVGHKVLRIAISQDRRATGIAIQSRETGATFNVSATAEVILAAGAIHSPQILQRSGVGPRKILEKANIPLAVELPGVGQNFQDRPVAFMNFAYKNDFPVHAGLVSAEDPRFDPAYFAAAEAEYKANHTGPLTFSFGNSYAFIPLKTISQKWSDIIGEVSNQTAAQYLPNGTDPTLVAGFAAQKHNLVGLYNSTKAATMEQPINGKMPVASILLRPLSRGSVNIDPSDPYAEPLVDFNTFANPVDLEIFLSILRLNRKWFNTTTHQQLKPVESPISANLTTDAELTDYVRNNAVSSFAHPCCTNSMMPKELGGVVGPDLLVHGMMGLSIVDASIMPITPATHLCATVYAIAEKAADMIKGRTR